MKALVNRLIKSYDVLLNVIFVVLLLFTAFVICYYCLPEQTSEIIAKALSYTDNPEVATTFMDYLNGFTIGAGFPLWFSQKAMISRYINNSDNKTAQKSTQEILAENIELAEIQIEFQKAEALRFANSPTMPAKARVQYKKFLSKLEERAEIVSSLKEKAEPTKPSKPVKKKVKKVKAVVEEDKDKLDSLV